MAGLLVQELGSGCSGIQCHVHAPTVPMYSFSGSLVFGYGAKKIYMEYLDTLFWYFIHLFFISTQLWRICRRTPEVQYIPTRVIFCIGAHNAYVLQMSIAVSLLGSKRCSCK